MILSCFHSLDHMNLGSESLCKVGGVFKKMIHIQHLKDSLMSMESKKMKDHSFRSIILKNMNQNSILTKLWELKKMLHSTRLRRHIERRLWSSIQRMTLLQKEQKNSKNLVEHITSLLLNLLQENKIICLTASSMILTEKSKDSSNLLKEMWSRTWNKSRKRPKNQHQKKFLKKKPSSLRMLISTQNQLSSKQRMERTTEWSSRSNTKRTTTSWKSGEKRTTKMMAQNKWQKR